MRRKLALMRSDTTPHAAWLDAFFASYYAHRPVNASFIGRHDRDAQLPDYSDPGAGDTLADMRDLLQAADAMPDLADALPHAVGTGPGAADPLPRAPEVGPGLTPAERMDLRLACGFLRIQIWEYESSHFQRGNPSLYTGEAIFGFLSLFLTDYAPLAGRVESARARLDAIPGFLSQVRDNVRAAPPAWTTRAIRECDGALALFSGGVEALSAEQGIPGEELVPGAERAARAFSALRTYLEADLLQRPNDGYACGDEALDRYLRDGHFIDTDADEIVPYAESRLAESSAYLREHAADFGAASPEQALRALADLHPPPDGYNEQYDRVLGEVRDRFEERRLLTWPDFPIRFVPRPVWVRGAAPYLYFLFYRSPAAFGRPDVHDYLVEPIGPDMPEDEQVRVLRAHNDSVIKLNHVVHHGGPGHHVQNWHAFRSESRIGRVAAVDCASRIAMFCGGTMAEGWACYVTDLAAEAGLLTPLERYAALHGRVRMAARAVVDVRLHQGRMSLTDAVDYYRAHAGMTEAAASNEAVKNSMFPGAALMYLLGTDAIHDLRAKMMVREGREFDACRFHDRFLAHGSVPVALIAENMLAENTPVGAAQQ